MPIYVTPAMQSGTRSIDETISFHETENTHIYLQESHVPFLITLLSNHPEQTSRGTISSFSPDFQYSAPLTSVKGWSDTSMHHHDSFEFTYILSGNMYQIVEGKRYYYPPGSCCLMNRHTLHTEDARSTDFYCIFFSLSKEYVKALLDQENIMLFPLEKRRLDNLIFNFMKSNLETAHANTKDFLDFIPLITEDEQKDMVHHIFEEMLKTMLSPYNGATYHLQDLFFQLIDILCNTRYYNVTHVTAQSSMESMLFSRINQVLKEHNGRISTSEIAELLNYDGSYLGRIVKSFTGQSLFDYSVTFTMKEARELLINSELSVSEIMNRLDFSNRTHFYKLFKEHYGVTPLQYRKQKK